MENAGNITTAELNKQLLKAAYAEAAQGKSELFRGLFRDDVTWSKIGTTSWSKTYTGRAELRAMHERLYALLDGPHLVSAQRFMADGDVVVVEALGKAMTKAGKPYNNSYCMIYRLAAGRIAEVKEYCDTALIDAVL
jgi:ketosteroid isomerase-like protein